MKRWMMLCVLACSACGDAGERAARDWAGAVDTIGGLVRVTNPAAGTWADGDAWQLQEWAHSGRDSAQSFASISALEVGDDGRIYVLDRQLNQLRIFNDAGMHLRTVGRTGRGPAEFTRANGLQWLGDTLVVIDGSGARYTLLDREGAFIRTVTRPLNSYGWVFQGGADNGMLYESGLVIEEGGYRSAIFGVRLDSIPVMADTVSFPPFTGARMQPFEVTTPTGSSSISVPFWPGPAWHMNADGTMWYGHGSEYRIQRLSLDGDTLREIVAALPAVDVSEADRAEWEQLNHVKQFRELGGEIVASRIPRQKPFFRELFTDDGGHLWVEPLTTSDSSAFDIFDANGRYLGRIESGVRREATVKPVVRGDRLYLVTLDEADVPQVVVMRIRR